MDTDRSLRQRLRATVLEASTPAGKAYNAVVFGAILLSVLALLLEPDPLGNSALRQTMCSRSIWSRTFAWQCLRRISFCIWPWWRSHAATCSASPD